MQLIHEARITALLCNCVHTCQREYSLRTSPFACKQMQLASLSAIAVCLLPPEPSISAQAGCKYSTTLILSLFSLLASHSMDVKGLLGLSCLSKAPPSPAARAASVRLTPCVLVGFSLGPRPSVSSSICRGGNCKTITFITMTFQEGLNLMPSLMLCLSQL